MSLYITSLASGSNGNCYYVGNATAAVLIDAGISCREIEKRMSTLQLTMETVKAVFISHEHIDHIRGITTLARKYNLPVYITLATLKNSNLVLDKELVHTFKANQHVTLNGLTVTPFEKQHDAADPFSFIVEHKGVKVGVLTDIGKPCKQVIHYFKQCHAAFLETNYDEQMLENGNYPPHLKRRIRGDNGHLSNNQALQLFIDHKSEFMSHLILAHLSKDNNNAELVQQLFSKHSKHTHIIVASRYNETAVFHIKATADKTNKTELYTLPLPAKQMTLF